MPVRKFNYTDRKPLQAKDIPIHIVFGVFNIDLQNISDFDLPPESLIIVEPYKNVRRIRVPHGTVGNPVTPSKEDRDLSEFSVHENILFRVKIVEEDSGKILAEAKVNPHIEGKPPKEKSLLAIDWRKNVEECWRLDFVKDDEPELIIDNSLVGIEKSEHFLALVYPAVLREVLAHILLVTKHYQTDDETRASQWLRFGKNLDPDLPDPNHLHDSVLTNKVWEWIDSVTARFAMRLKSLNKGKSLFSEK